MEEIDLSLNPVEPNLRDFTKDVVKNISPMKKPQVLNALPTHPTLQLNMKFQPSKQSHDEVYGCLKSGSGNNRGKRLAISMVEETWLSDKEERKNVMSKRKNVFVEEKECIVKEKECFGQREKNVFTAEKRRAF
nr:hypothetical protein [Tanacetum cinerariifolium]